MAETVVVGMSGGVDSSTAAALLVEQGWRVIGVMLHLWTEEGQEDANRCCAPDALARARRTAARLSIPFYVLDSREIFYHTVVKDFISQYQNGLTPNPCLMCNQAIRWGFMLQQAEALGADYLATGHYARLERQPDGEIRLLKARDASKDQSYVLAGLNQAQLTRTLFPLANMTKTEVRSKAMELGLDAASQPDSQDLCFIPSGDYRSFLQKQGGNQPDPGDIINLQGKFLGMHEGLERYTIGQRKRIRVASAKPLYVLEKDKATNRIIVGTDGERSRTWLETGEINWIAGESRLKVFEAGVKIRYRSEEHLAQVTLLAGDRAKVKFNHPVKDITPGQQAVFYQDDTCMGGGKIIRSG